MNKNMFHKWADRRDAKPLGDKKAVFAESGEDFKRDHVRGPEAPRTPEESKSQKRAPKNSRIR